MLWILLQNIQMLLMKMKTKTIFLFVNMVFLVMLADTILCLAQKPMTSPPAPMELREQILKANKDSDVALFEYWFWSHANKCNDVLYYALYLVGKTDSPAAHRIIWLCMSEFDKQGNGLAKEDEMVALRHLCYSFRLGDKEAREVIGDLFVSRKYREYDICDSLCRDCPDFPYRKKE